MRILETKAFLTLGWSRHLRCRFLRDGVECGCGIWLEIVASDLYRATHVQCGYMEIYVHDVPHAVCPGCGIGIPMLDEPRSAELPTREQLKTSQQPYR